MQAYVPASLRACEPRSLVATKTAIQTAGANGRCFKPEFRPIDLFFLRLCSDRFVVVAASPD